MGQVWEWVRALFSLIALLLGVILVVSAAALIIGFWPLALIAAAGGLFALAKLAARD